MMYLRTKFHKPSTNSPLGIDISPKADVDLTGPLCFFTSYKKILNQS